MPIVKLRGSNDEEIFVEVEERRRVTRGGIADALSDRGKEYIGSFGLVGEYIMSVCEEVYMKYKAAGESVRPNQLEIEFGIKVGGETGIPFVSKGTAEAAIKVTAKWGSAGR